MNDITEKDSMLIKEKKLTIKEMRFCEYYLQYGNGAKAARDAGYKGKKKDTSCKYIARDLLTKTHLRAYIDKRLKEQEEELIADTNECLRFKTNLMRGLVKEERPISVKISDNEYTTEIQEVIAPARDRNNAASDLINFYQRAESSKEEAKDGEVIDMNDATLKALQEHKVDGFDDEDNGEQ